MTGLWVLFSPLLGYLCQHQHAGCGIGICVLMCSRGFYTDIPCLSALCEPAVSSPSSPEANQPESCGGHHRMSASCQRARSRPFAFAIRDRSAQFTRQIRDPYTIHYAPNPKRSEKTSEDFAIIQKWLKSDASEVNYSSNSFIVSALKRDARVLDAPRCFGMGITP